MIHPAARPTDYGQVYSVSAMFNGGQTLFFCTIDRINRRVTRTWKRATDGSGKPETTYAIDDVFEKFVSDLENVIESNLAGGYMNSLVRVDHYSLISDLNAMSACEEGAA